MMAVFAVIFNKMIGGVTGVYLSDVPADQYFHGNMFVTAHFHFMLMGAGLFGAMGAIAYYFPKMTGRFLDERMGSIGFWTAFVGFQGRALGVAVGLGVSTGEQAAEIAAYADGVIVGSAFIRLVLAAPRHEVAES